MEFRMNSIKFLICCYHLKEEFLAHLTAMTKGMSGKKTVSNFHHVAGISMKKKLFCQVCVYFSSRFFFGHDYVSCVKVAA
jgi:hypothetical protein